MLFYYIYSDTASFTKLESNSHFIWHLVNVFWNKKKNRIKKCPLWWKVKKILKRNPNQFLNIPTASRSRCSKDKSSACWYLVKNTYIWDISKCSQTCYFLKIILYKRNSRFCFTAISFISFKDFCQWNQMKYKCI